MIFFLQTCVFSLQSTILLRICQLNDTLGSLCLLCPLYIHYWKQGSINEDTLLINGKTPDILVNVEGFPPVYVTLHRKVKYKFTSNIDLLKVHIRSNSTVFDVLNPNIRVQLAFRFSKVVKIATEIQFLAISCQTGRGRRVWNEGIGEIDRVMHLRPCISYSTWLSYQGLLLS